VSLVGNQYEILDMGLEFMIELLRLFQRETNICTWDLSSLDYFNVVVNTHIWDPNIWMSSLWTHFLGHFTLNVKGHTYAWDPRLWMYIICTSSEENTSKRGMKCWDPPYVCNKGLWTH
jgi:hypothetical protein